jgi:hypothetical protein
MTTSISSWLVVHDIVKVLYICALPTWPKHYPFICKLNFVEILSKRRWGQKRQEADLPTIFHKPWQAEYPDFLPQAPLSALPPKLGSSFLALCSSFSWVSWFAFLLTCLVLEVPVSQWIFFWQNFVIFRQRNGEFFYFKKYSIVNSSNFDICGSNFAKIFIPKKWENKHCAHPP